MQAHFLVFKSSEVGFRLDSTCTGICQTATLVLSTGITYFYFIIIQAFGERRAAGAGGQFGLAVPLHSLPHRIWGRRVAARPLHTGCRARPLTVRPAPATQQKQQAGAPAPSSMTAGYKLSVASWPKQGNIPQKGTKLNCERSDFFLTQFYKLFPTGTKLFVV